MKQWCLTITAALLIAGCTSYPEPQRMILRCQNLHERGYYGFYSFTTGELTPPVDSDRVDILYYFDGNDCSEGALIGHDDQPGYLFAIGHKSWRELIALDPPTENNKSPAVIAPLTREAEGFAFWVKTKGEQFFLVRIRTVQPASYTDLVAGAIPQVELEWIGPRNRVEE